MASDADDPFTAEDWIKKSKEALKAARVLSNVGLQNKSFVEAGLAVECALKYAIMRGAGINGWPARDERRDLYTHDLPELARISGLDAGLLKATEQATSLGLAWMVVKDWKIETRYSNRSFPKNQNSADDQGSRRGDTMASKPMAMTEVRLDSGRRLLEMTDQLDFGALAAAWVQDSQDGHWWYLLVTAMVDTLGPAWIYERLLKVFQKWHLPDGISPLDIRVASPFEHGVRGLFQGVDAQMINNGPAPVIDVNVGDGLKARAIVPYRIMASRPKQSDSSKAFDQKVHGLLAA